MIKASASSSKTRDNTTAISLIIVYVVMSCLNNMIAIYVDVVAF